MNTGVLRIVTISCTDSDDARWRGRLAQESRGLAQGRHGMARETMQSKDRCMGHLTLRAWRTLRLTETIVPTRDSGAGRKPVSTANAQFDHACQQVLTTLIVAGNAGAAIMPTSAAAGRASVAQFASIHCSSVHSFQISINLLRRTPPIPGVAGGNNTCARGAMRWRISASQWP